MECVNNKFQHWHQNTYGMYEYVITVCIHKLCFWCCIQCWKEIYSAGKPASKTLQYSRLILDFMEACTSFSAVLCRICMSCIGPKWTICSCRNVSCMEISHIYYILTQQEPLGSLSNGAFILHHHGSTLPFLMRFLLILWACLHMPCSMARQFH